MYHVARLAFWASAVELLQLAAADAMTTRGALLSTDPAHHHAPAPRLSSVFVSLGVNPDWNASRWTTLVADLKAIEVTNLILADSVTENKAWYPSKIPGLSHADVDVVSSISLSLSLSLSL